MKDLLNRGDILTSKADCLVNTVNCFGVMGAGVALDFKNRYPELYNRYKSDYIYYEPGKCYFYNIENKLLVNATTKYHWKDKSKIEWVISCLDSFIEQYVGVYDMCSVAIPLLGAGLGGLNKELVHYLIKEKLEKYVSDLEIWTKD